VNDDNKDHDLLHWLTGHWLVFLWCYSN